MESLVCVSGAYEDWLKTPGEIGADPSAATPAPVSAPRAVVPVTPQPSRHVYRPRTAEPQPAEPAPAPVIYYEPAPSPVAQPQPSPVPAPQPRPLRLPEPAPATYQKPEPLEAETEPDTRLMWWERSSSFDSDYAIETASEAWTAVLDFLDGHLDIGLRLTKSELEDNSRSPDDAFLGNITKLEGDEDFNMNLFFDVMFIKYVGIEYTSYKLTADTYNWNSGTSDGSMEICGPVWSVIGRFPNRTRFTPYAGIGRAFVDADFKPDTWWYLGYGSEDQWISYGKPTHGYRNIRRNIAVDGDDQTVMFFGCAIRITDWLSADLYYRSMDITLDAHYHRTGAYSFDESQDEDGEFVLDHTTMGFGLKYVF